MIIGILEDRERSQLMKKARELLPRSPADKRRRVLEAIESMPHLGISISPDNSKLGAIMNFSLPAGQWFREATCPGASKLCENICYAFKGYYIQLQEYLYWANWAYLELWPERFYKAFTQAKLSPVFRVHVGGDFFDPAYVELWNDIAKARPHVRFFAYTRSWQNGKGRIAKPFIKPLRKFARMDNARLVLSIDSETGIPSRRLIPEAIRAWLAVSDEDMPPEPVELIFRHRRGSTMSAFPPGAAGPDDGTPICPYERLKRTRKGAALKPGAVTCQNCAWCWGAGHAAYGLREEELDRFDLWAGVQTTLEDRVSGMFHQFVPWRDRPGMSGPATTTEKCVCSAVVLCNKCGLCVGCLCECP